MNAHLRKFLVSLSATFWLLPAATVLAGLSGGEGLVSLERAGRVPSWLLNGWLYSGGESGARTLLGAVASSTIGVAGTIFSITIASLTLASNQMGPRLLDNFTKDRGNQATLGLFLGTFAFALMVLRAVRGVDEGAFVPHLAVTIALSLAIGCVAMLVFFVHHMSGRINVDTVIDLVHKDLRRALDRLTLAYPGPTQELEAWTAMVSVNDRRHGYLQQLDAEALADWAAKRQVQLRLLVRPGDFVFPGARVLEASQPVEGLEKALLAATATGSKRVGSSDLEFSVRQLVDVAVRALSPGINDPQTAISVLDRLGAGLCEVASRHLATGIYVREGIVSLVHPVSTYDGLTDAMFNLIRQNARTSAAVLIRMMDVLGVVVAIETGRDRLPALHRHADLVLQAGREGIAEANAVAELEARYLAHFASA
jgi:uncharacterized membrane protein